MAASAATPAAMAVAALIAVTVLGSRRARLAPAHSCQISRRTEAARAVNEATTPGIRTAKSCSRS